jgi:hypothetical protein
MVAFTSLAIVLALANVYPFTLYRSAPANRNALTPRWSPAWLDFDAQRLGGFSYRQLALASVAPPCFSNYRCSQTPPSKFVRVTQ